MALVEAGGPLPLELPPDIQTGTDLLWQLGQRRKCGKREAMTLVSVPSTGPRALVLPTPLGKRVVSRRSRRRVYDLRLDDSLHETTNLPAAQLSGPKPVLLRKLEQYLEEELPTADNEEDILRVYRNTFQMFIESFPTYGSVLGRVKNAYDDRVGYCSELEEQLGVLRDELATARHEASEQVARAEEHCAERVQQAAAAAAEWQRAHEVAAFEAKAAHKENSSLLRRAEDSEAKSKRDEAELGRLKSSLSFLSEISDGLKRQLDSQTQHFRKQRESMQAEVGAYKYSIENLEKQLEGRQQ